MPRLLRFLASLMALFLGVSTLAQASTIDLSWGTCSPVQATYVPEPDLVGKWLLASVLGQAEAHQGYQVRIVAGDAEDALPDAWRFDAAGCQGTDGITIANFSPAVVVKACPPFSGARFTTTTKSFQLAPPELGVPATMGDLLVRSSYALASTQSTPGQRYFLAGFFFDHLETSVEGPGTPGVTCGGFERPVCFSLLAEHSWWERAGGERVAFDIGQGSVVFRSECHPVPAAASTWGTIKGQYRR